MKRLKSKNHLLIAVMLLSLLMAGCGGSEQPGVVYKKSAKSGTVHKESVQPESGPKVSAQSESVSKTSAESGTVPKESVQAETASKESAEGGSVHNEPPQTLTGKADAVGKKAGTVRTMHGKTARSCGLHLQGGVRRGVRASGSYQEGTGKSGSYGMWNLPRGHVWNVFVRPASS